MGDFFAFFVRHDAQDLEEIDRPRLLLVADDVFKGFYVSFFKSLHNFLADIYVVMVQDFLALTDCDDVPSVL